MGTFIENSPIAKEIKSVNTWKESTTSVREFVRKPTNSSIMKKIMVAIKSTEILRVLWSAILRCSDLTRQGRLEVGTAIKTRTKTSAIGSKRGHSHFACEGARGSWRRER